MTLDDVNRLDRAGFVAAFGCIYEHSPWVAASAFAALAFTSIDALHGAMVAAMQGADDTQQLSLLRAHPELAGKAAIRGELTADSTREQNAAGLAACSASEFAQLTELNARYNTKFGFPFILAVKGYDRAGIIAEFARRIEHDRASEFAECLQQIAKITRLRLDALLTD